MFPGPVVSTVNRDCILQSARSLFFKGPSKACPLKEPLKPTSAFPVANGTMSWLLHRSSGDDTVMASRASSVLCVNISHILDGGGAGRRSLRCPVELGGGANRRIRHLGLILDTKSMYWCICVHHIYTLTDEGYYSDTPSSRSRDSGATCCLEDCPTHSPPCRRL